MQTFSVPIGIGPSRILTPFPDRTTILNPRFRRTHFVKFSSHRPFLGVTRFGLGQVPVPDPDSAQVLLKEVFERIEGLLYTVADAAVSGSPEMVAETTNATKQNSDWLSGITNAMETVLKILKDGLSAVHVPYSYGFAIILLTVIVKAATFPLTKKQVESTMAMRSLAPQIKAIQEKYAGDQERIQLETARLYKLAGINPLAGCLPTLATIPIWIGLYRALSNVADAGLLTEGFFWIPSLSGPTSVAARQTGGGTSWLFNFVDGHPPLGWSDTLAYLVLPVLLVVSQYISVQIMQSQTQQSNDPNMKTSQILTKFLPLMIGYFSLSVPSGLSLYWFTNNILSTAQQIWLQKLGGAQNPLKKLNNSNVKNDLLQVQKSLSNETTAKTPAKEVEKLTPKGPQPGERFRQLKEQEARKKKQREEEKRKAEEAAAQSVQTSRELEKDDNLVDKNEDRNRTRDSNGADTLGLSSGSDSFVANGASSSSVEVKQDTQNIVNGVEESEISDKQSAKNNQQANGAVKKGVGTHALAGTQTESPAANDVNADIKE